jgi:hypothetical protein
MRVLKCSEPERFDPTGYWASQGLETEDDVRWEMMWQAVTSDTDLAKQAREHADGCDYCGDVLERYKRVAYAMKPGGKVLLAICPSAAELYDFLHQTLDPEVREKIGNHVQRCRACSKELKWLARSEKASHHPVLLSTRARQIAILAAAALLAIGAVIFATVKTASTSYTPIQDHVYGSQYRDLAKLPMLNRMDLLNAAPASHWQSLQKAMSALELGENRRAISLSARLISDHDEPAAEYILGRALYREIMMSASKEALLKSEQMQPMSPYRCWSALQIGLILGDKPVVLRECKHLENNPEYSDAVKKIREEVERRDAGRAG